MVGPKGACTTNKVLQVWLIKMESVKMSHEYQLDALFTPSSIRKINQDGFAIIRNFFDATEMKPIYEDIKGLAKAFYDHTSLTMPNVPDDEIDRTLVGLIKDSPKIQSTLYDRLQLMPANLALPNSTKVRRLAKLLFGSHSYGVWPRLQARFDVHQDMKNVIEWHHDYLYNQGTKHSWTLWLPLVNIQPNMGLLRIAPRTHIVKIPFKFTRTGGVNRFDYTLEQSVVDNLEIVMPDHYSAGDLVIFHSLVVHAGAVNQDHDRARLVTLFRIQDLTTLEALKA
jgi:hypothetical protein